MNGIYEQLIISLPTVDLHLAYLNTGNKIYMFIGLCWPWPGYFARGARIQCALGDGISSHHSQRLWFIHEPQRGILHFLCCLLEGTAQ